MFERIKQIVIKEFIQTFRDKRMRFFLIVPPIIQLMMFGYVVTMDVERIPTAVYDLDQSADSRELVRRLSSSGYFIMQEQPRSTNEIMDLLDGGGDSLRGSDQSGLPGAGAEGYPDLGSGAG